MNQKIKKVYQAVSFVPYKSVIRAERFKGVNRMYNSRLTLADKNVQSDETVENNVINQFYPGLQRYCHFLSKNKWDGDDLAQEAIIKASQSYQQSEICSALLNKIAYHHWIDTLRKKENEVVGIHPNFQENHGKSHADGLMDTVQYLMNHLTPKQAVILMLKEAFRYQSKEIADLLKSTEMAVKASLHRAKNRLSKEKTLHSVHSYWDEEEKEVLFDLIYQSLQAEDPKILIDRIPELHSLTEVPRLIKATHSSSPLNSYCMAA
jgi:RNA polymerase sigma factor (sigma-70 family)